MSLLAAIPGLSAHETAVPAAPVPANPAFDLDTALRVLRDGLSLIASEYPPGALQWLRDNRPDVMGFLRDDQAAINRAFLAENMADLSLAVDTNVKHHRRAYELFAARPPVVETQGELL